MKIYFKFYFILLLCSNLSVANTCKNVFKNIPITPPKQFLKIDTKEHTVRVLEAFLEQARSSFKDLNKEELLEEIKSYTPEQNYEVGKFFLDGDILGKILNKDIKDMNDIVEIIKNINEVKDMNSIKLNYDFFNQGETGKALIFLEQAYKQGNHKALDWLRIRLSKIIKIQLKEKSFKELYFNNLNKEELSQLAEFSTAYSNFELGLRFYSAGKLDQAFILFKQAATRGHPEAMHRLADIYSAIATTTTEFNKKESKNWKQKSKQASSEILEGLSWWQIFKSKTAIYREFELKKLELQIKSTYQMSQKNAVEAFLSQTISTLNNLNKEELLEEIEFFTLEQVEKLSWKVYPVNKDYALILFHQTFVLFKHISQNRNLPAISHAMYWLADIYSAGTETMPPNPEEADAWLEEFKSNPPENLDAFALKVHLAKIAREKVHPTETISKTIFKQTFPSFKNLNFETFNLENLNKEKVSKSK